MFTQKERKDLDVNTLRQAVEDLVRKKRDYVEVGISARHLYHVPHMQVPVSPTGKDLHIWTSVISVFKCGGQ